MSHLSNNNVTVSIWLKLNNIFIDDNLKCIYKITSPTGKIYIGQSKNILIRFKSYINCLKSGKINQPKLQNSFLKYGIINHKLEIVEEIIEEQLLSNREIYYIKLFNTFNSENGLNLTSGGESAIFSKESREKLSQSKKGCVSNRKNCILSEETKNKISISKRLRNKKLSKDHKSKISQANKNRIFSPLTILKAKETRKKYLENRPADFHKKLCKTILQYDLQGNFIKETTRTEIRLSGISVDAVKRCLNNKAKTSNGFKWEYKEK